MDEASTAQALPFQGVIFDLDGVVIDSEALHEQAKRDLFTRYNLEVPERVFDQFRGKPDRLIFEHVLQHFSEVLLDINALIAEKQALYQRRLDRLALVPGVKNMLTRLRARGLPIGLATSSTFENQQRAFARFGLAPFFDIIVTDRDVMQAKPAPDPYLEAAARLHLNASDCLVIEDAPNGIEAARLAGCRIAALTTSFKKIQLLEAGAEWVEDDHFALYHRLFPT